MATILVADDNSNIQKMVGLALKDHGIDVVAVGNGEAAVRRLPDVHPDLILADIFMPVKNGYEVCEFVKKDPQYSHIPVILLVGAFDPLDEREAQRVGADGVLKKPFIPPDPLISMVKSALARASESKRAVSVSVPRPVMAAVAHPEPAVEEPMPLGPAAVSFGDTDRPLAFGSLLETTAETEAETQPYVAPVLHPELSDSRTWGTQSTEEQAEEEEPQSSWRAHSVPEELLTDDKYVSEPSPYADAVLTEKEDIGTSTGAHVTAGEAAVPMISPVALEGAAQDLFVSQQDAQAASPAERHPDTVNVADEPAPESGNEREAGSETAAEHGSQSERHQPQAEPQSEQKLEEPEQITDYETVFTRDAFPGLFIEEKPPMPLELAEQSLQESPSAFAELSTGVEGFEPVGATCHSSETHAIETDSSETQSSEPHSPESTIPPKLPSLWEEQVRQAARLIASAWPGDNGEAEFSQPHWASMHADSSVAAPFATELNHWEHEAAPSHGQTSPLKASQTSSQPLEGAPAPVSNSWLTQQGQQLISSGVSVEESSRNASNGAVESKPEPITDVAEEIARCDKTLPQQPVETGPASLYLAKHYEDHLTPSLESIPDGSSASTAPADHSAALAEGPVPALSITPSTAPTKASDLEDVVAKVLARMNPEMFQSMTQQLLKPVIEAIVRAELEKK